MSANLTEILVEARSFPDPLALPVQGKFGDITIETTIDESYRDTLQVTEHPVESGSPITDHSFRRPAEVVLRCGWSNASLAAFGAILRGVLTDPAGILTSKFVSGSNTRSDYVGRIYSRLLNLQQSRQPFSITTTLRVYNNMLMSSLGVTRDQKTSQVLMVEASCREVILVSTQSTTLPAKDNQANPASTAETQDAGVKQLINGAPTPSGSVPPPIWTP